MQTDLKNREVKARITQKEREIIENYCNTNEITVSAFLRELIYEKLYKELEE